MIRDYLCFYYYGRGHLGATDSRSYSFDYKMNHFYFYRLYHLSVSCDDKAISSWLPCLDYRQYFYASHWLEYSGDLLHQFKVERCFFLIFVAVESLIYGFALPD